jgi:hypothetical protein
MTRRGEEVNANTWALGGTAAPTGSCADLCANLQVGKHDLIGATTIAINPDDLAAATVSKWFRLTRPDKKRFRAEVFLTLQVCTKSPISL